MLVQSLKDIFVRDLNALKNEVELYQNEDRLWYIEKRISNSGGNLCLHLVGNLKTFIGLKIGGLAYTRDRPFEFSGKNVPRAELIQSIDETIEVVMKTLDNIKESDLDKEFPLQIFSKKSSIGFMLVHLSTHLKYHLGQINYHRRLLDIENK